MPSSKHERLYGERKPRRKVNQAPSYVEGGLINDRSGQATKRLRRQGFQLKKGITS